MNKKPKDEELYIKSIYKPPMGPKSIYTGNVKVNENVMTIDRPNGMR